MRRRAVPRLENGLCDLGIAIDDLKVWQTPKIEQSVAVTKGAFSLKKRHATEWRLTEFPCDLTHALPTKDFMRWQPSQKIQNTVPIVKPSVPVAKPNGNCGDTDVAQKQRDGIRSETVSGNFHDSRFHQRDTTSLPGDRAVIPGGTARLRGEH